MAMTAREAAWTALQRWRKNGAWSDAALNIVLQNAQLSPRDAALAARICYGTLQNLTLLDHYLAAYCTTPLQKLEPKVLDLLRLSAYQIVLLDKVPPRAAVRAAVRAQQGWSMRSCAAWRSTVTRCRRSRGRVRRPISPCAPVIRSGWRRCSSTCTAMTFPSARLRQTTPTRLPVCRSTP